MFSFGNRHKDDDKNENVERSRDDRNEEILDYIVDNKWRFISGSIVLLMVLFLGSCMLLAGSKEPTKTVEQKEDTALHIDAEHDKNKTILLIGLDNKDDNSEQRADSIIMSAYNHINNSVEMLRIPRDLYVEHNNYKGKINSLYGKDFEQLKDAVGDNFGLPIDNYIIVDFEGLVNVIDAIGGIEIDSNITINKSNNKEVGTDIIINKGYNKLNGKEALAYSRIRSIDNDIERGKRQEQVLFAIKDRLLEPSQLPHLKKNITMLKKYVKTDIDSAYIMAQITKGFSLSLDRIDFKWEYLMVGDQSMVRINHFERQRIADLMRDQMGLNKEPIKYSRTKPYEKLPDTYTISDDGYVEKKD